MILNFFLRVEYCRYLKDNAERGQNNKTPIFIDHTHLVLLRRYIRPGCCRAEADTTPPLCTVYMATAHTDSLLLWCA
jgi:hypothetical protein